MRPARAGGKAAKPSSNSKLIPMACRASRLKTEAKTPTVSENRNVSTSNDDRAPKLAVGHSPHQQGESQHWQDRQQPIERGHRSGHQLAQHDVVAVQIGERNNSPSIPLRFSSLRQSAVSRRPEARQ